MVRVLLFICSAKKNPAFHLKKYPHIKLSRSTFVFPESAEEELKKVRAKSKILRAEFNDKELDEANNECICSKRITVKLGGEHYITSFLRELETLEKWASSGVREDDEQEYENRKKNIEEYLKELLRRLFDGKLVQTLEERVSALREKKTCEKEFPDKHVFLSKTVSEKFDWFKQEVLKLLRTPKEIGEIARATEMKKSNARKWLNRMARAGLITKTRKRRGVGRPKNIYYLSRFLR